VPPAFIDTVPLITKVEKIVADEKDGVEAVLETEVAYPSYMFALLDGVDAVLDAHVLISVKTLFIVAVPPNPNPIVCAVVPAVFVSTPTISNSYTVLADSVTPTPNKLCAVLTFVPARSALSL
jgi:hypothetical protein